MTPRAFARTLVLRRLFFVGIMVLVYRGTVAQLVLGIVFSIAFLLLQMQANPFVDTGDDYLANACSFALCLYFVLCLVLKVAALTDQEEVLALLAPEQRIAFDVPSVALSVAMVAVMCCAIALSFAMLLFQLARERRQMEREARVAIARRLRIKEGLPDLEHNYRASSRRLDLRTCGSPRRSL